MRYLNPLPGLFFIIAFMFCAPACASAPDPRAASPFPTVATAAFVPPSTSQPSPTPFRLPTEAGSLRSRLGGVIDRMPQSGSNEYVVPTDADRAAFKNLVDAILAGDFIAATAITNSLGYSITEYTDSGDDEAVDFLLEETSARRGWGWYVFRKNSINGLIIETPHPFSDMNTHRVALDAYRALDARALLVAGAHRDANTDGSADVSHTPGSIYQVVHNSLVEFPFSAGDKVIVLQIHGFDSSRHPKYPPVVIGYDRKASSALTARVQALKDALINVGLTVGICDGKSWEALCGTTDVINIIPNGLVIHIELNESIREDDRDFVRALERVFVTASQ